MAEREDEDVAPDLVELARRTNAGDAVALRALAGALPFPRIRINMRTGEYFLRVGPIRLDVDPRTAEGWEWLGFDRHHQCRHTRRADHQVWGPAWVECVLVPTGVDLTEPGPLREIGGERAGRPGMGPESVIIDGDTRS